MMATETDPSFRLMQMECDAEAADQSEFARMMIEFRDDPAVKILVDEFAKEAAQKDRIKMHDDMDDIKAMLEGLNKRASRLPSKRFYVFAYTVFTAACAVLFAFILRI